MRTVYRGELYPTILPPTSYILPPTSHTLHLTSYILPMTRGRWERSCSSRSTSGSGTLYSHPTSYILLLTSYILHILHLTSYILLKDELDAFAAQHLHQLRVVHVVGETPDAPCPAGWSSTDTFTAETGWIDEAKIRK